ncbi:MAG: HDOD domain-containing protein [Pirellulaceae bacterium]
MSSISLAPQTGHSVAAHSDPHRLALERLFRRISDVSTLPTVAQQVMQAAQDPKSDARVLQEIIQRDVVLTATILRRANAAIYARQRKTADLAEAVAFLGFREVRNICLTVFVSRTLNGSGSHRKFSRESLWRHCLSTAVTCEKLARITERIEPEEAYVSGLLHHLGTILIDQHLHRYLCRIIDRVDQGESAESVERDELSFTQSELGAYVLAFWRLPEAVVRAVENYRRCETYRGTHRELVSVVALADYLCTRDGWTSLGVRNARRPGDEVFRLLGLEAALADGMWEGIKVSVAELVNG